MKKFIFVFLTLVMVDSIYGDFNRTTGLIDIPTAYILPHMIYRGNLYGSFAMGDDPNSVDFDFTVGLGLYDKGEVAVSIFTTSEFAFHGVYQILKESVTAPAVAFGIHDIANKRYVSSVGSESTWEDDETYPRRCSEQFSIFFVSSKDFGKWGTYHLGFGRGRFVGYGPRSKLFNTDIFSDVTHNDAFGFFWGGEIEFFPNFEQLFDFDGRDFNIGWRYKQEYFDISLAIVKLEHRLGGLESLTNRFSFGVSVNSGFLK